MKNMRAYVECLKHFIEEEQTAASAHSKAANSAAEELGKAAKAYNEQAEAAARQ
jgi:hypothetical protein